MVLRKIGRWLARRRVREDIRADSSCRCRILAFWAAFEQEEETLRRVLDERDQGGLVARLERLCAIFAPGVAFEAERSGDGLYELTLSWHGDPVFLYHLEFWRACVPDALRKRWRFFPAIQPAVEEVGARRPDGGVFHDREAAAELRPDRRTRRVWLRLYVPDFAGMSVEKRRREGYFLLEHYVGEFFMAAYVSGVEFCELPPEQGVPLHRIAAEFAGLRRRFGWEDWNSVCDIRHLYRRIPVSDRWREDVVSGFCSCPALFLDQSEQSDELLSRIESFGFTAGALFFDFPEEETPPETARNIREELTRLFAGKQCAFPAGQAFAPYRFYCEWMVFDEPALVNAVQEWAADAPAERIGYLNCRVGERPLFFKMSTRALPRMEASEAK